MSRLKLLACLLVFMPIFQDEARASYSEPLFRGAEAQAMGGAFTATTDDDLSLFYNPAGLAGAKKLKFRFVNVTVEASDDLIKSSSVIMPMLSGGLNSNSINSLIGKNDYIRIQDVSTFSFQGFALAAIGDAQAAVRLLNPYNPTGTIGLQTTYGAQLGYGTTLAKFAKNRGEIRFGVAGKYLQRAGGFQQPSITDLLTLNTANIIGDYKTYGTGIGIDSGTQVIYNFNKKFSVLGGIAVTDIGNTTFSNSSPSQLSSFNAGLGAKYKSHDVLATFAFDYQRVLDSIDWQKKIHLGMQLKFPLLTLYGGFSECYPSFGVGLDLGIVQVLYTSYTGQLASLVSIDPEHRNMINVRAEFNF